MNNRNFCLFCLGAAVGASVALLLAPESGRRTRARIRRRAEDAQYYLEDVADELTDKGRELYERGRDAVGDAARGFGQKVKLASR